MSQTQTADAAISPTTPSKREIVVLAALCGVVLAANVLTAPLYPLVWDEVGFVDPAVNLLKGRGLTSTTQYNLTQGTFFFGDKVLYPLLIYPWIAVVGLDVTAVRAFNHVLIVLTAVLLWAFLARGGYVRSPVLRLAVVALVLLGQGISYSYRSGRADTIAILLFAATLLAFTIPSVRGRRLTMGGLAALYPWAGLQLVAFAVVVCGLALLYLRRKILAEILAVATGAALGFALLLAFYFINGVLIEFIVSTFGSQHSITGQLGQWIVLGDTRGADKFLNPAGHIARSIFQDPSVIALLVAALYLLAGELRRREFAVHSALSFAIVAAVATPVAVLIAGKYPLYYSWMGFLLLLLAGAAAFDRALTARPAKSTAAVIYGGLALSGLLGLPTQLIPAVLEWRERDYAQVEDLVARHVAPDDWVYVDNPAYWAAITRADTVLTVGYAHSRLAPEIPAVERDRVRVIIVPPERFDESIERIGGTWRDTGDAIAPDVVPVPRDPHGVPIRYDLRVYTRAASQ